ncbi:MAG TPA: AAA family ATPase [Candidatus Saccharimonadales bacterium]|nr:AAA family ATPase [Candidatus Saccharimonadales bacterium]
MVKIYPNKPLFVMLYGYPGSGKTFFARQLCEELQSAHVQGERIRHELFETPRYDKQENSIVSHLMDYMTEQFLSTKTSVVYDVNVMRTSQRRTLKDIARKSGVEPILVWFQIDIESAFTRVARRDRRRADDKYAMPLDRTTYDSIINNMQNPTKDESPVVVSGKHTFNTQLSSFTKKLRETGLVTTDFSSSKVKPELVNLIPNHLGGRVDLSRRNIVIR